MNRAAELKLRAATDLTAKAMEAANMAMAAWEYTLSSALRHEANARPKAPSPNQFGLHTAPSPQAASNPPAFTWQSQSRSFMGGRGAEPNHTFGSQPSSKRPGTGFHGAQGGARRN